MGSHAYLMCELLALFVGLPAAMYARILPRVPIVVLLVAAAGCTAFLWNDARFDRSLLWNAQGACAHARGSLLAFGALAVLLVAAVAWRMPRSLFDLVRTRPRLWLVIMVLYPLVSVFPQEVIYRAFFFERYAVLFPTEASRVLASAAVFAFGHVFFPRPWIAVSLTFLGGILFAFHYAESHSLLLASGEHALFGQLVFTIGLGRFFYSGGARSARPALSQSA